MVVVKKLNKVYREGNARSVPCISFWRKINQFRGNQHICSNEKSRLIFLVLD